MIKMKKALLALLMTSILTATLIIGQSTEVKAETKTRLIWKAVVEELRKKEPELAAACVPNCFYRGFCPEFKSCGLANTETFPLALNDYINSLN